MADTKSKPKPTRATKEPRKPRTELPPPGPEVLIYKPL